MPPLPHTDTHRRSTDTATNAPRRHVRLFLTEGDVSNRIVNRLLAAAAAHSATVTDCGNGHFQIRGKLLVNYYPFSKRRTAYVAGTTIGHENVSPSQAVAMTGRVPTCPTGYKAARHIDARAMRKRLLRRSDRCHWCRARLVLDTSTLDHVIPLSRGGLDHGNNVVLTCEPCNRRRGNTMPELSAATESTIAWTEEGGSES